MQIKYVSTSLREFSGQSKETSETENVENIAQSKTSENFSGHNFSFYYSSFDLYFPFVTLENSTKIVVSFKIIFNPTQQKYY